MRYLLLALGPLDIDRANGDLSSAIISETVGVEGATLARSNDERIDARRRSGSNSSHLGLS